MWKAEGVVQDLEVVGRMGNKAELLGHWNQAIQ